MKKIQYLTVLLLFIAVAISSCKKDKDDVKNDDIKITASVMPSDTMPLSSLTLAIIRHVGDSIDKNGRPLVNARRVAVAYGDTLTSTVSMMVTEDRVKNALNGPVVLQISVTSRGQDNKPWVAYKEIPVTDFKNNPPQLDNLVITGWVVSNARRR